jgi:hypothetical protein
LFCLQLTRVCSAKYAESDDPDYKCPSLNNPTQSWSVGYIKKSFCVVTTNELFNQWYVQTFVFVLVFGTFFLAAAVHGEFTTVFMSAPAYFIMLPATINILMIYASCNLHDVSWGNRDTGGGDDLQKEANSVKELIAGKKEMQRRAKEDARVLKEREDEFKKFRTRYLLFWLATNIIFATVILNATFGPANCFLTWLALIVASYNGLRLIGSVSHVLDRGCRRCCGKGRPRQKERTASVSRRSAGGSALLEGSDLENNGGQNNYVPPSAAGGTKTDL